MVKTCQNGSKLVQRGQIGLNVSKWAKHDKTGQNGSKQVSRSKVAKKSLKQIKTRPNGMEQVKMGQNRLNWVKTEIIIPSETSPW